MAKKKLIEKTNSEIEQELRELELKIASCFKASAVPDKKTVMRFKKVKTELESRLSAR